MSVLILVISTFQVREAPSSFFPIFAPFHLSNIVSLAGEETDEVEVYDSCAEIRKKITAYLKRPGVTQAQFLRDLISQYHTDKAPARIQSSMLNKFRGHKGVDGGNTSSVFYASYCFFERLRIKEGKNKSKHRQEMGEAWGSQGGFDTKNAAGQKL